MFQIPSSCSRDLKSGWEKRLGCRCSGFWMRSEIRKPNHLKFRQMNAILSKTIWNRQKCLDIEQSSFWMVGTVAIAKALQFENRTIWNMTFKKSGFQLFEWSDFRSPLKVPFLRSHIQTKTFFRATAQLVKFTLHWILTLELQLRLITTPGSGLKQSEKKWPKVDVSFSLERHLVTFFRL